jgi:hypothetical protein
MNISLAAADLTKWVAFGPVKVDKLFGRNDSGAELYLQLHQSPVVLANDVPVPNGVLTVPTGEWFDWFFEPGIQLSELTIAVSTTKLLYTAPGAGLGVTATCLFSSDFAVSNFSGLAVAGDLTTNVASLAVWADVVGPKRLYRLDVLNNGNDSYPYISARNSPAAKNSAQNRLETVLSGNLKSYFFGVGGYSPVEQYQSGTSTLTADGCTVVFSASPDIATTTLDATADKSVRAIYA